MSRFVRLGVVACVLISFPVASAAAAKDYSETALNITAWGQYGSVPPPPGADEQAKLYDALTPLFNNVTEADLHKYFKSGAFGVAPDGPKTEETVPRPGVTIYRDRFNVPHVYADKPKAGVWAAGWIAAEDRGLVLESSRFNGRVAAIDAPGLSARALSASGQSFVPSERTEAEVEKQTMMLKQAGKQGKMVLADIDTFISGINDYRAANGPTVEPWTRNDIYALNAFKGQFLGQGGGDEVGNSEFLTGLQERLGERRGMKAFDDMRQFKNPGAPTSVDGRFPYGKIPDKAKGSVVLDPGSYEETPAVAKRKLARAAAPERTRTASNTLQINAERSATGHPLMVGGPQLSYNYPGFTYEIDMHAGRLTWRGATAVPFPGYLLIGRGPDFATTLTSAQGDIIDEFANRTCGGSETMYRYKGSCRRMRKFNAGTLGGEPVEFMTTKHGPVVGYATVDGKRVAISKKRSSYGQDVLDQLFFRRLSNGSVKDPESFFRAASKTPQTFNSFYIDHKHNAMFTSGRLPVRHPKVDPGLPTKGFGKYNWQGFLSKKEHPQGVDPKDGTLTNWNNVAARGFGASDVNWAGKGEGVRVDLLDKNLKQLQDANGKWTLASVTAAMNAAATQDVRAINTVPLLAKLLRGSAAPNSQAEAMLAVLEDWHNQGGSRLDRNLDGKIDHPGAAVIDGAWDGLADALMRHRLPAEPPNWFRRFSPPPGPQYDGWHYYFERDIRELVGGKVRKPLKLDYCGNGDIDECRKAMWNALAESGEALTAAQGTADPSAWRADATGERINFLPVNLTSMRYANRPSFQQVISFDGHR